MRQVVSGFAQVVRGGRAIHDYDCSGHFCARHPRSAMGFDADRRTLYLMVVDGRSGASRGATLRELGDQMLALGAHAAVNLDGGGSSALWVRGAGVVNRPSDGNERVVANHLAVHASGDGQPGHCVDLGWERAAVDAPLFDAAGSTDVNGDGRADVCARTAAGVHCRLSTAEGFGATWATDPELGDAVGWADPSHSLTVRFADVTGDGRADVCARASAGMRCWPATGDGFADAALVGPPWSDAEGWDAPGRYASIRAADVDGDGRADLCARGADGVDCHLSTGAGFGPALAGPRYSDATGWNQARFTGTLRFGDVDGDGRHDLCARGAAGVRCYISDAALFDTWIPGPEWSDEAGWGRAPYWSTLRLGDLDGDDRDDLCGRGPEGVTCHLSVGDGFGPPIAGPRLTDDSGWADPSNYGTLRLGDVTGDGRADLCARGNAGVVCWPFEGAGFGASIEGPRWSDDAGWFRQGRWATVRLADLNADGALDVCGRGGEGVRCADAAGGGFGALRAGPAWADRVSWDRLPYWGTVHVAGGGPLPEPDTGVAPEPDAGTPFEPDAGRRVDGGVEVDALPVGSEDAAAGARDAGIEAIEDAAKDAGPARPAPPSLDGGPLADGAAPRSGEADHMGGCQLDGSGPGGPVAWWLVLGLAGLLRRWRDAAPSSTR
jgi:hypothetical protein